MLDKYNQKITFFVSFRLEDIFPGLLEKIIQKGHEVGWHGYSHIPIKNSIILKKELKKSEKLLKKFKIKGFQSPEIVFFREGYTILKKHGFSYSSSTYGNSSMVYDFNGVLEIPVSVNNLNYTPKAREITFPSNMSIKNLFKFGYPVGSGYFWKILGKKYYGNLLDQASNQGKIINLFIHNWQLVRHNQNYIFYEPNIYKKLIKNPLLFPYIINVSDIFESLISRYKFQTFREYIKENKESMPQDERKKPRTLGRG